MTSNLPRIRSSAAVFEAIEPTNVKGKRWVVVEAGPTGAEATREGWLLEEQADAIRVMDSNGRVERLVMPRVGQKRPSIEEEQRRIEGLTYGSLPDYGTVWRVRSGDFPAYCRRLEKEMREAVVMVSGERSLSDDRVVAAAQCAYWLARLGEKRLALELCRLADSGLKANGPLERVVANDVVHERYAEATNSACRAPRLESLRAWEKVVAIPYHKYVDEAKQMVRDYKSLIAEDEKWKEPGAEVLKRMTLEQKAAYWVYHLRDVSAHQWSIPGTCCLLSPWDSPSRPDAPDDYPPRKLKELGMAAVPLLVAHLDDTRPTRSVALANRFSSDPWYVLRYGDCCQQIFEGITGRTIYRGQYPHMEGKAKECKAEAERWWKEYQQKGDKRMLIEAVEAGDRDSAKQAERLLAKYPNAIFEPLVKGARRSKDPWVSKEFVEIADRVRDVRVTSFLQDELRDPQRSARVAAARALTARNGRWCPGLDQGVGTSALGGGERPVLPYGKRDRGPY